MKREVEYEFASEEEADEYQRRDWDLRQQVKRVLSGADLKSNEEHGFYVLDDWWPNATVNVEADESLINKGLLQELHSLLTPDYRAWCIAIEVYKAFTTSAPQQVGPLRIYSDEIMLIQRMTHVASEA